MTITGLDRAQAQHDNMEPPTEADCECDRWRCPECGTQYDGPGTCTNEDCTRDTMGPTSLAELDDDYLMEALALTNPFCPAHGGCTCGHDRCPECG